MVCGAGLTADKAIRRDFDSVPAGRPAQRSSAFQVALLVLVFFAIDFVAGIARLEDIQSKWSLKRQRFCVGTAEPTHQRTTLEQHQVHNAQADPLPAPRLPNFPTSSPTPLYQRRPGGGWSNFSRPSAAVAASNQLSL